jgi:hypothetical protein
MLDQDDTSVALSTLRVLLQLEREGVVVVERRARLVSLAASPAAGAGGGR